MWNAISLVQDLNSCCRVHSYDDNTTPRAPPKRGSGISVLAVRHDDDDGDDNEKYERSRIKQNDGSFSIWRLEIPVHCSSNQRFVLLLLKSFSHTVPRDIETDLFDSNGTIISTNS